MNLDNIPNTWDSRAWKEAWLSKIEMDKCTQLFHFAIDEAKTLRGGERVHVQNQEHDKAGHFNINRRTWWFVFHPCVIRETHHMALVSSSCSKGHTTSFSQMRLSITQPSQVLQHHHQCHLHLLIQYLSYIIIDSTKHFNQNSLKVTTSSTSPPLHSIAHCAP